jgi:hypothetical protein
LCVCVCVCVRVCARVRAGACVCACVGVCVHGRGCVEDHSMLLARVQRTQLNIEEEATHRAPASPHTCKSSHADHAEPFNMKLSTSVVLSGHGPLPTTSRLLEAKSISNEAMSSYNLFTLRSCISEDQPHLLGLGKDASWNTTFNLRWTQTLKTTRIKRKREATQTRTRT